MKQLMQLVCSILLVAVLSVTTIAAPPQKVSGLHDDFADQLSVFVMDGEELDRDDLTGLLIQPGSQLEIYLIGPQGDERLFLDQNGNPMPTSDVTRSRMHAARMTATVDTDEGAGFITSVELGASPKNDFVWMTCPVVTIRFADRFDVLDDTSFRGELRLQLNGKDQEQATISIAGSLEQDEQEITAEDTSIDLQDGRIAVAVQDNMNIEVYLGEGVSVNARLTRGERYSGSAWLLDEGLPDADLTIVKAYQLQTQNLDHPGNRVSIDTNGLYYVYGDDGVYLGTTRSRLPYSGTYYLAEQKTDRIAL